MIMSPRRLISPIYTILHLVHKFLGALVCEQQRENRRAPRTRSLRRVASPFTLNTIAAIVMAIVAARDMYKCSRRRETGEQQVTKEGGRRKKRIISPRARQKRVVFPVLYAIARVTTNCAYAAFALLRAARVLSPLTPSPAALAWRNKRRAMSYGTTTGLGRIWKTGNGRVARACEISQ